MKVTFTQSSRQKGRPLFGAPIPFGTTYWEARDLRAAPRNYTPRVDDGDLKSRGYRSSGLPRSLRLSSV